MNRLMKEYGKFHVGQRVRTTWKYKCKFDRSFEGCITSIFEFSFYNMVSFNIIDACNNFYSIMDTSENIEKYLEPVCPAQRKCKFKVGDYVRTTDEHYKRLNHKIIKGKVIKINLENNVLVTIINECGVKDSFDEYWLELDCDRVDDLGVKRDPCKFKVGDYVKTNRKYKGCGFTGIVESIEQYTYISMINVKTTRGIVCKNQDYLELDFYEYSKNNKKYCSTEIDDIKHEISRLSSDVWDLKYYYNSMNKFSGKSDNELSTTEECICFIILFAVLILATYGSLKFVGLI